MNSNKNISLPNGLEDLKLEDTFFPSNSEDVAIAVFSQTENKQHILRILQLLNNESTNSFEIVQELAAFSFDSRSKLKDFVAGLPMINGLEMLMLLNPLDQRLTTQIFESDNIN